MVVSIIGPDFFPACICVSSTYKSFKRIENVAENVTLLTILTADLVHYSTNVHSIFADIELSYNKKIVGSCSCVPKEVLDIIFPDGGQGSPRGLGAHFYGTACSAGFGEI